MCRTSYWTTGSTGAPRKCTVTPGSRWTCKLLYLLIHSSPSLTFEVQLPGQSALLSGYPDSVYSSSPKEGPLPYVILLWSDLYNSCRTVHTRPRFMLSMPSSLRNKSLCFRKRTLTDFLSRFHPRLCRFPQRTQNTGNLLSRKYSTGAKHDQRVSLPSG